MDHGTRSKYTADKCRCDACRAANAVYNRKYRAANPGKTAASDAKRRDVVRQRTIEHRAANPEMYREYARASYLRDRPSYLKRAAARRKTPEGKASARINRERRRTVPLTAEAVRYVEIIRHDPCVYCGAESQSIDHIVPVLHGGTGDWDNLAPACKSCNSRKHTKSLLHFLLAVSG